MNNCPLCKLENETVLVKTEKWRIILVDDRRFPGFCRLILNEHVAEMSDLPKEEAQALFEALLKLEMIVKNVMKADKINLASLGNMVPHVHWHIIPRFKDDTHFPESIWGKAQREENPAALEKRYTLLSQLKKTIAEQFSNV